MTHNCRHYLFCLLWLQKAKWKFEIHNISNRKMCWKHQGSESAKDSPCHPINPTLLLIGGQSIVEPSFTWATCYGCLLRRDNLLLSYFLGGEEGKGGRFVILFSFFLFICGRGEFERSSVKPSLTCATRYSLPSETGQFTLGLWMLGCCVNTGETVYTNTWSNPSKWTILVHFQPLFGFYLCNTFELFRMVYLQNKRRKFGEAWLVVLLADVFRFSEFSVYEACPYSSSPFEMVPHTRFGYLFASFSHFHINR